jgi:hypothetical protein
VTAGSVPSGWLTSRHTATVFAGRWTLNPVGGGAAAVFRAWRAWYAHITLSMLALAWLAASQPGPGRKRGRHQRPGMIGYTLPEIRRLLTSHGFRCSSVNNLLPPQVVATTTC